MSDCTRCAEAVPDGARFCPHCGQSRAGGSESAREIPASLPPSTAADPFSYTAPADPEELARVRDMIAASNEEPAIPVRERQFGSTKALSALEDRRTDPPPAVTSPSRPPVARERTMESAAVPSAPPPRLPPPPARAPSVPDAKQFVPPHSPRAATTAQPQTAMIGSIVRVLWSDGQTYPATVLQVTPTHCSVQFGNGHTQWIENRLILAPT